MIGLESVKDAINGLVNRMRLQKLRSGHGLPVSPVSTHMVFTGNPGTGKTSVARLLGSIFRGIGFLAKGHLVEVSRADLVGEYVGQTGPLVQKKVAEALDGILFIDEAYSLVDGDGFGAEAIATLLKLMEDNRERLVVIAAGYEDEMDMFVNSNPGLSSRFTKTILFPDYSGYELFQIYEALVSKFGYITGIEAAECLASVIQHKTSKKDRYFGNARYIRNLFEETLNCLANRISQIENPSKDDLIHIVPVDIRSASARTK
jgi:SpoVK/Ycf46/Vps4 family AAA+-type ATPase